MMYQWLWLMIHHHTSGLPSLMEKVTWSRGPEVPRRPTPLGNAFASGPFALGRCLRSRLENRGDKMVKLRKSDPVYHKDTSWYKFYITSHIQCSKFQWQEENLPYSTQVTHSDVRVLPLRHKCLAIMGLCVRWSKKYMWFMVIPSLGTPSDGCINPC